MARIEGPVGTRRFEDAIADDDESAALFVDDYGELFDPIDRTWEDEEE